MTQGFPAQPNFGQQPQQFAPPQQSAPQYGQQQAPFFTQQDPAFQAQQAYAPPTPVAPARPADTSGFFGGGASISWDDRRGYVKGTPRGGQIVDKKITNQTKMGTNEVLKWDNGDPRKQMELTLQTSERADPQDDGKRRMFIKGDLPRAAREAMKKVSATDLSVGGWFYAAWVSEKPASKPGFHDAKVFQAVYAPPGAPDPMAGQPAYTPAPSAPVPPPAPSANVDHYAAYAAQQAAGGPPVQPALPAVPQQFAPAAEMAGPAPAPTPQYANQAPAQFTPQTGAQPPNVVGSPPPVPAATQTGQAPGQWNPFGS